MGSAGWVIPAIVTGLGVAVLVSALSHFVAGRIGHGARHSVFGLILAGVGGAGLLLGLNTVMYARLTHEGPVAEISVKALDPAQNKYTVYVKRLDSDIPVQNCVIQGDEWLIAGQVQKWKPWANVLGLDATYSLDQIVNKYFTAARGNGKLITACDLTEPPPAANNMCPHMGAVAGGQFLHPRPALRRRQFHAAGGRRDLSPSHHPVGLQQRARERRGESGDGKADLARYFFNPNAQTWAL